MNKETRLALLDMAIRWPISATELLTIWEEFEYALKSLNKLEMLVEKTNAHGFSLLEFLRAVKRC